MALITRVSRLFRADLHAVLDQVEEPEILLGQAVREMEEELAREEQRFRILRQEHAQLAVRQQDLEQSRQEIDEELDICFESEKDDLARALIKRKLETQRLHKVLSRKRNDLEATLSRVEIRLKENRARLDSMRQKLDLLTEEEGVNDSADRWTVPDVSVRDADVEVAFLREKKAEDPAMKQPRFLEGVAVALTASFAGSLLYTALTLVAPGAAALPVVVAGLGLAYILYLLSRSRQPVGRTTTMAAWSVVAMVTWLLEPPLILYVLVHLAMVWVVRSLYFYSSLLSALADLGLNALSLAAAVWALVYSGSLFLAIWCLFLVQALFVAIPATFGRRTGRAGMGSDAEDRFERAHRVAETALRRLSSIR